MPSGFHMPERLGLKQFAMIGFVMWMAAITTVSIWNFTGDGTTSMSLEGDGLFEHSVAYFISICLYSCGFARGTIKDILLAGLLICLYGVALEIIQVYLPFRSFNIWDIVANTCGIIIFLVIRVSYLHLSHPKSAN